jgi:hypothetical protein
VLSAALAATIAAGSSQIQRNLIAAQIASKHNSILLQCPPVYRSQFPTRSRVQHVRLATANQSSTRRRV